MNKKFWEEQYAYFPYISLQQKCSMLSPPYKISSKSSQFKSCTHLRSLNVGHFGMVEAMALNIWSWGHLQCHHLHTRFHPNPLIGSKVIKGFLCTHLRSLNVRHFGMAAATRLKNLASGSSQWHHLPTKFHESPPIGSKVISGGHTDTHMQTDRLVIW
jgi:hypothetical protein